MSQLGSALGLLKKELMVSHANIPIVSIPTSRGADCISRAGSTWKAVVNSVQELNEEGYRGNPV